MTIRTGTSGQFLKVTAPTSGRYSKPAAMDHVVGIFQQMSLAARFALGRDGLPSQKNGSYTVIADDADSAQMATQVMTCDLGLCVTKRRPTVRLRVLSGTEDVGSALNM